MAKPKFSKRGPKICGILTSVIIIILIIVFVVLFLAVLKPKRPEITPHPASLENISIKVFPNFELNVTLGLVITVNNRNVGAFKFKNTTSIISYRGNIAAEVPITEGLVRAHAKLDIDTYANVTADKLISNPHFFPDVISGRINLTSTAELQGKVIALKVFKLNAKVISNCDISIVIKTQGLESQCSNKISL